VIKAKDFINSALGHGFGFFCGVPCSFLTPLIDRVIADERTDYIAASSEGEAVAIAAGAWLAGKHAVMMCQNSGLGNAVNPLTSLNTPFRIPTLLIVTWRGKPGLADEPQHELMGQITPDLLELMAIPYEQFPTDKNQLQSVFLRAKTHMEKTGLPYALIMEKGDVEGGDAFNVEDNHLPKPSAIIHNMGHGKERPKRVEILDALLTSIQDDAAVIATTGKCGRELFTLNDRAQHLYQVGSMGAASAMGLGVALNTKKPVVVLDGDGAALMKLGNLATIGAYGPENLLHIILDNGTYCSTGGQLTTSAHIDFLKIADACGYQSVYSCDDIAGFALSLKQAQNDQGPVLLHVYISTGSMKSLGRPTIEPHQVAARFKKFLKT